MTATGRVPTGSRMASHSVRLSAAVLMGRLATRASRVLGVGDGTAIGGRFATKVMPGFVPAATARHERCPRQRNQRQEHRRDDAGSGPRRGRATCLQLGRVQHARGGGHGPVRAAPRHAGRPGGRRDGARPACRGHRGRVGGTHERVAGVHPRCVARAHLGALAADPGGPAVRVGRHRQRRRPFHRRRRRTARRRRQGGLGRWRPGVARGLPAVPSVRVEDRLARGGRKRLVVRWVRVVPAVAPLVGRGRRRPRARSPRAGRSR